MDDLGINLNNSTNTTPPLTASFSYRISSSIALIVMCLIGLIGYTFYIYVVLSNLQQFKNPFYAMTISLCWPDCVTVLLILFYSVPVTIMSETGTAADIGTPMWIQEILGFLCDYVWFVICGHMVLIAMNRIICLHWASQYDQLFNRHRMIILLIGVHLVAFVVPSITYYCSCRFEFIQFAWGVTCEESSESCGSFPSLVDTIWTNSQISFVIICDVIILIIVAKKGRKIASFQHDESQQKRQFKREKALVLQFTSIAIILVITQVTFWCLPNIIDGAQVPPHVAGFLSIVMTVVYSSVNPFFYFLFGSELRSKLPFLKTSSTTTTTVSSIKRPSNVSIRSIRNVTVAVNEMGAHGLNNS